MDIKQEKLDETLEAFRSLLFNWNKPQLKERWLDDTRAILQLEGNKHSFIFKDNDYITMRFMPQSIDDILNIASLKNNFDMKYRYHDEEGFLSLKPKPNLKEYNVK
jgi:hypothetical protein